MYAEIYIYIFRNKELLRVSFSSNSNKIYLLCKYLCKFIIIVFQKYLEVKYFDIYKITNIQ